MSQQFAPAKPKEVRHFVPAPGMAVLTTEYRTKIGSFWLPDTSVVAESHGEVLGIGAIRDYDIPLHQGDKVSYAPYAPKEFDLGDGVFTMVNVRDIFTIEGKELRTPLLYDYRLPEGSIAGDTLAWLCPNHVLIRPYSPVGFKKLQTVAGEKTIWLERDEKHPKVWAHILAVRHDTHKLTDLMPGDLVLFKRHSEEVLGYETPLHSPHRTKLPIAITHLDNVEAVATGEDAPKAEF